MGTVFGNSQTIAIGALVSSACALGTNRPTFTRLPFGHPEAFIEAFANIYLEAARAIEAEVNGQPAPSDFDFPTVTDGVEGMMFIATAVKSAKNGGVWTKMATG